MDDLQLADFLLQLDQHPGLPKDADGGLEVRGVLGQLADVEARAEVSLDVGGVAHGGEGDDVAVTEVDERGDGGEE